MAHLETGEGQQAYNHPISETVEERNFNAEVPSLEC